MTAMIEKMARAELAEDPFLDSAGDEIAWEGLAPHGRDICLRRARAALTAMLEPTEQMVEACGGGECGKWARGAWDLMIKTALGEDAT